MAGTEQHPTSEEEPSTDELEEPSAEKDPGEEPRAAADGEEGKSHQAVGIGVLDGPGGGESAGEPSPDDAD